MNRGRPRKTERDADIAAMYVSGKTPTEIAAFYGLNSTGIYPILHKQGIALADGRKRVKSGSPRNLEIVALYKSGKTLEEVGAIYDITRERTRQIVASLGFTGADGGSTIRSFLRVDDKINLAAKRRIAKESLILKKWSLTFDQYQSLIAEYGTTTNPKSPLARYAKQRQTARMRGIEWQFTFASWWAMWQESGKWELRGRGQGYCMARHGDSGAYSPSNTYICTIGQNFSDSYITKPHAIRFAGASRQIGSGKGYSYCPTASKRNPYKVNLCGKYIGCYPTAEAAHEAYLKAANDVLMQRKA